eukprot:7542918-Ditylum_brightwellii.AAC.1
MMFHGDDGSVDNGKRLLTHLTHEVDCGGKQNVSGPNATKSKSVFFSAISNEGKEVNGGDDDDCVDYCFDVNADGHVDCCVDIAKDNGVNDSVDGCESSLTHEVDRGVKQN